MLHFVVIWVICMFCAVRTHFAHDSTCIGRTMHAYNTSVHFHICRVRVHAWVICITQVCRCSVSVCECIKNGNMVVRVYFSSFLSALLCTLVLKTNTKIICCYSQHLSTSRTVCNTHSFLFCSFILSLSLSRTHKHEWSKKSVFRCDLCEQWNGMGWYQCSIWPHLNSRTFFFWWQTRVHFYSFTFAGITNTIKKIERKKYTQTK